MYHFLAFLQSEMTSWQVIKWLKINKLTYWVPKFKDCAREGFEIDGDTLFSLDDASLIEDFDDSRALARKKLLAKIYRLKQMPRFKSPPLVQGNGDDGQSTVRELSKLMSTGLCFSEWEGCRSW